MENRELADGAGRGWWQTLLNPVSIINGGMAAVVAYLVVVEHPRQQDLWRMRDEAQVKAWTASLDKLSDRLEELRKSTWELTVELRKTRPLLQEKER